MCWHIFDTLCSLLSSLIFSFLQTTLRLFVLLCLVRPAAYGKESSVVPMEITLMDSGLNIFALDEFIE
jgi:hypothetical protein